MVNKTPKIATRKTRTTGSLADLPSGHLPENRVLTHNILTAPKTMNMANTNSARVEPESAMVPSLGMKPPVEMVGVEKQRESLKLLEEQVFSDDPFDFPSELYNYLAGSNWRHWGQSRFAVRKDFPLHDVISMWQTRVLSQLLSSTTLGRMHDTEFKVPSDQDVLTTAELIERLTKSIFSELDTVEEGDFTNRKPAVSSLRRSLQREHLRMLARLAMGDTVAPDDCQTIAFAELSALEARIGQLLKSNVKLDSYSRAHLQETESRINKVLSAELSLFRP